MWVRRAAPLLLTLMACDPTPPAPKSHSIGEMNVVIGKESFGLPFKSATCEVSNGTETLTLISAEGIPVDGRIHFPDLLHVQSGPGKELRVIAYLPNVELAMVEYPMAYLMANPPDGLNSQCEVSRKERGRTVKCRSVRIMPWWSVVPSPMATFMAEFECPF